MQIIGLVADGVLLSRDAHPTAEPQGIWGKLWGLEVGPDYKRPEVRPVEDFRSQIGPSEATSLADLALVAGVQ